AANRHHGQANAGVDVTLDSQRSLDRRWIGLIEQRLEDPEQSEVLLACLRVVTTRSGRNQLDQRLWVEVASHTDHARGAHGQHGQGQEIVARKQADAPASFSEQMLAVAQLAGGIFDGDDIRAGRQQRQRALYAELDTRTRWNVVKDDRRLDSAGDSFDMLDHARLIRLVVVGHDDHDRVSPRAHGSLRSFDAASRAVRPRTGNDRDFVLDYLLGAPDQLELFLPGQ